MPRGGKERCCSCSTFFTRSTVNSCAKPGLSASNAVRRDINCANLSEEARFARTGSKTLFNTAADSVFVRVNSLATAAGVLVLGFRLVLVSLTSLSLASVFFRSFIELLVKVAAVVVTRSELFGRLDGTAVLDASVDETCAGEDVESVEGVPVACVAEVGGSEILELLLSRFNGLLSVEWTAPDACIVPVIFEEVDAVPLDLGVTAVGDLGAFSSFPELEAVGVEWADTFLDPVVAGVLGSGCVEGGTLRAEEGGEAGSLFFTVLMTTLPNCCSVMLTLALPSSSSPAPSPRARAGSEVFCGAFAPELASEPSVDV